MSGTALAPLITYTLTEVVSAAAQVEILAAITKLKTTILGSDVTSGTSGNAAATVAFPDADGISPVLRNRLYIELANLATKIDAMPAS